MTDNAETEDSISIADIFWRLWDRRGIIIFVPLLFVTIAVLVVIVASLAQTRQATYLISLRNIENQRYPNGAEFSPRDLIIPEILGEVRRRFDISPTADLMEAISVSFDSPLSAGIAKKYQQRLSARNLSAAEIEAINQSYLEELRTVMRSSLRVSVDYRALGLDSSTGLALASELPRLWTTIYTTKYRIFTDRRLANLAVTRSVEKLDTAASVVTANARINSMRYGLTTVTNDNRLSALRTSEGMSPTDLLAELDNFQSIWLNPVKGEALRGIDSTSVAYLDELRLNIAEKKRQIAAFDVTLTGLSEYQRSGQAGQSGQIPAVPGDQMNAVQVGDSAFSSIIQLAEQASFTGFVQQTLDERRNLMIELAGLEKEREFANPSSSGVVVTPEFVATAAQILQEMTTHYSQLMQTAETQLRDRAGDLYQPLLGPMLSGNPLLSSRNLMIVVAAGLAGGLLAVIGVLIAGMARRPRRVSEGT